MRHESPHFRRRTGSIQFKPSSRTRAAVASTLGFAFCELFKGWKASRTAESAKDRHTKPPPKQNLSIQRLPQVEVVLVEL